VSSDCLCVCVCRRCGTGRRHVTWKARSTRRSTCVRVLAVRQAASVIARRTRVYWCMSVSTSRRAACTSISSTSPLCRSSLTTDNKLLSTTPPPTNSKWLTLHSHTSLWQISSTFYSRLHLYDTAQAHSTHVYLTDVFISLFVQFSFNSNRTEPFIDMSILCRVQL